ncbi:MAG: sulfatase-like hydrolase/transferase [Planctomycetes bacterium]|nr:sulfatase-like hydrolase/transferase [Planctomycetota bacterium]
MKSSSLSKKVLAAIVIFAAILLIVGRSNRNASSKNKIDRIVLITMDTTRADYLSCYGFKRNTTPNIDALAREGVLFENVIAPTPMTLPTHSTIMTGTTPLTHGVRDNTEYVLSESNLTLAEVLKENGYNTAAIISAFVLDRKFGLNQGFNTYDDRFDEVLKTTGINERRGAETTKHAVQWLDDHADEKFFLFLHYYDPHLEYVPPEPFKTDYADNLYAGEIAYTDKCIGQVIDKLKQLGIYDSTLIIIAGDHGEMLGEHQEGTHSYFIYQAAVKVPMIFKLPFKNEPKKIKSITGLIDIAPTVYSLLGIDAPSDIQGRDLTDLIVGKPQKNSGRYVYCESLTPTRYNANALYAVVNDRFKYIQTLRPELYDLLKDPHETNNLVNRQTQRARIMQDQLTQILDEQTTKNKSQTTLDMKTKARLEALGYVATGNIVTESRTVDKNKADPKDLISYHEMSALSIVYITRGEFEKAEKISKKILQDFPSSPKPYRFLANIAYQKEDFALAIQYFTKYIKLAPPDHRVYNNMAIAYSKMEKKEKAIESYQLSIELSPDFPEAHYNLGYLLARMGRLEEAIQHLQIASKIRPDDEKTTKELKLALEQKLKVDENIEQLKATINKDTASRQAIMAHYKLARIFEEQEKFELAIKHYNEIIKIKPDHIKVRVNLADVLVQFNKADLAIEHFYYVLKKKPKNVNTLNALAWILSTTDNKEIRNPPEAVKFAKKACELVNYKSPELLDTLAAAYAADGKFDKAINTAEKAINLANENEKGELADMISERLILYKKGLSVVHESSI